MRLSHWPKMVIDLQHSTTLRHRRNYKGKRTSWVTQTCTCITFSPFGQLSGEQDVGQLTLGVGFNGLIVLLPVQVIKLDLAHGVSG